MLSVIRNFKQTFYPPIRVFQNNRNISRSHVLWVIIHGDTLRYGDIAATRSALRYIPSEARRGPERVSKIVMEYFGDFRHHFAIRETERPADLAGSVLCHQRRQT